MGEGGGVFDTGRAPGFVTLLIGAKIPDAAKQTKHHESLHNKCFFFLLHNFFLIYCYAFTSSQITQSKFFFFVFAYS